MKIYETINQDQFIRKGKGILLSFSGKRHVLSSSVLNGGWSDHLISVFNFDEKPDGSKYCEMTESTYEEHLKNIALHILKLDPDTCTGLSTAADMDNMVIESSSVTLSNGFPLTVTAAITGGIDQNGARPGDPACWEEFDSTYQLLHPGTINIILHINAALTKGAMVRAVITGSEAKACACSELFCPSLYSEGIATGSGTDGMIVVSDPSTSFTLTAAGKDSQLGEMIGTTIMKALKKAIGLQTDVTPKSQHHAVKRLERFGITMPQLYALYTHTSLHAFLTGEKTLTYDEFTQKINENASKGYWTGKASFLAHLLDQLQWEMLNIEDVREIYPLLFRKECPETLNKEILLQTFSYEMIQKIIYETK